MAESTCTLKKGDRGGEEGQFKMIDQHLQSYSPWKAALCQGPARSSVYVRGLLYRTWCEMIRAEAPPKSWVMSDINLKSTLEEFLPKETGMLEIIQLTYERHLIEDFPKFDKSTKNEMTLLIVSCEGEINFLNNN